MINLASRPEVLSPAGGFSLSSLGAFYCHLQDIISHGYYPWPFGSEENTPLTETP